MGRNLYLQEEVLLLALHDERGTVEAAMPLFALAGALLAELMLRERVRIEQVRRSKLVTVVDATPVGEAVLDGALQRMSEAKRRATPAAWVARLAQTKRLRDRVADGLCELGILRREEGRVLWVFRRTRYPAQDMRPEVALVAALRQAVAGDGAVTPRIALLVALTYRTGILRNVVDRSVLRQRRRRVESLASGHMVAGATAEAIAAAEAAAAAAVAAISAASAASAAS